ncbi:hypothetical protein HWV62_3230 [Athelia sp. TMB]|nr:hypothetical protein HWV62_3230 [Athelia sp. TMB]
MGTPTGSRESPPPPPRPAHLTRHRLLWAIAAPFLGAYTIVQDLNTPLIVQPQIFCALSLISWGQVRAPPIARIAADRVVQVRYYGHKHSKLAATTMTLGLAALLGGLEVGIVFGIKSVYHDGAGNARPVQFTGIFAAILIALALFPQYYEIWKHGEVIGISITFMVVDLLGGVFSDLSLVFRPGFDVIAATSYSLVVVLDAVVIICAIILNPRANKRRLREAGGEEEAKAAQPLPETAAPSEIEIAV